ncbi:MAG TPA: hypothetical protein VGG28_06570 [Kofleriaceae bacterium]|jgi:hypothetical protein
MRSSHCVSILVPLIACAACAPKPSVQPIPPAPPVATGSAAPVAGEVSLDHLGDGEHVLGFTARALYVDDRGAPIGARFVHDRTGFTVDYLRIESAPQAHLWVTTYPTGDKGEPHTQEHLLLYKGNRGRTLGSDNAMALVTQNAFTEQWRTSYTFKTVAGPDAYWGALADQLGAMLNPDETDEEIRREVRNVGVDKAGDGKLRLEEKGTVYNEMVGAYEDPEVVGGRAIGQLVYGATHPLALEAGGFPDAIRAMTPADIRTFHDAHYFLANMGMIGAYPSSMPLPDVLAKTGAILDKAAGRTGTVMTAAQLPKPQGAAPGAQAIAEYPFSDAANASPLLFAWPATRQLDLTERTLAGLFLDAFAGDSSTPIYTKLVDSKTHVLDLGATAVHASISADEGQPISLELSGVRADKLDAATLDAVRGVIAAELDRIAKLPDGDPQLRAFDQQVVSRVIELRRKLAKLLGTPPGFGERTEDSTWLEHLHELNDHPGFRKSLTLHDQLDQISALLASPQNPWRTRIHAWGLDVKPYAVATKPSPSLRKSLDAAREQRLADELARLQKQYKTADAASTLARYAADYDKATKELDASARAAELPPLTAAPPMTLDDSLQYDTGELAATRTFVARVPAMSSTRVELAFDVREAIGEDDQVFLAALPALLGDAGVIENGTPISAAEARERQRVDILGLDVEYIGNPRSHRVELAIAGSGNGPKETRAALAWMQRVLFAPDWRVDNVARLRDLIAKQEAELHAVLLGYEEHWVKDPRDAWAQQDPIEAHTQSLFTELHDLHRLRWMLAEPDDTGEVTKLLNQLATTKQPRAKLAALAQTIADGNGAAAKLSPKAKQLAQLAGKDLAGALADLPDDSLAADWSYLCREMAKDLGAGAAASLARLDHVRQLIVQGEHARLVEVGSPEGEQAIAADVEALVRALPQPQQAHAYLPAVRTDGGPFMARLAQREPVEKSGPKFVGLVDASTSMGVFLNLAPAPWYGDTGDDAVLDYLASNLYTGHGGHSIYAKTLGAGLAYSNGVHSYVDNGQLDYYAERCPLLSQTLSFVVGAVRGEKPDKNIARYAIANAFTSRIADSYERRADKMAGDLVDGLPPDLVRAFRTRVLELAKRPDLADALYARMPHVYGKVLPGLDKLDPAATYFVIGPEKQLVAYEAYLHAQVAKTTKLHRLYPRDFWIPAKL